MVDVAAATRDHPEVSFGASPRASLALLHAAKAHAAVAGRAFVTPDDVQAVAAPVLAHRLAFVGGPDLEAGTALVSSLLDALPVPRG